MKHKFKMHRTVVEEIDIEIDYSDNCSVEEIFFDARVQASKANDWKVILVDRPEHVESTVDFSKIYLESELKE